MYSDHAQAYVSFADRSGANAWYERPAILRLAGNIQASRVLELGCAGGGLTAQLVDRGAEVLALDREPRLVELARRRLGGRARVEVAELEQPLDMVATQSIDLVVASLVLHYIEDWAPLLGELRRCLRPGGGLVFSVHHPITGWGRSDRADYHRTELVSEEWDWDGIQVTAQMYRRPFSAIFGFLREAGFTVDIVDEPSPEATPDIDAAMFQILSTKPVFLFVRAVRT